MKINSEKSTQVRDTAIGKALARRLAAKAGECLLPEDIALLVDGLLDGAERDKLLGHLASCEKCRDVFLATRQLQSEKNIKTSRRGWYVFSSLATAAVVVFCMVKVLPVVHQSIVADTSDKKVIVTAKGSNKPVPQSATGKTIPGKDTKNVPVKPMVAANHVDKSFALLTAEEAALPAAKVFGFAARVHSDGPAVLVESPSQDQALQDPFRLSIKFEARPGTRVDLESFKLVCLKEQPVDLTSRVKPYVTSRGIDVRKVRIPPGSYRFRLSIAEYHGKLTEKEFVVRVVGAF